MPKLLFLTQRIPYPPTKGEKIRTWQIVRHLARTHEVHLGCLIDDPDDMQHRPVLRELCADTYFAPLNRRWAKLWCLRGLLTGDPLSVTFFHDRGLAAWVRRVLQEVKPDAIVVCSSNMAHYVLNEQHTARVRIVDMMDVDSEKWRAYAAAGQPPMRWVHHREWRLTAAMEHRIARECDWTCFVSPTEAALFERLNPEAAPHIRAISNGVDAAYFAPQVTCEPVFETTLPNFVFTGTMDYPPNMDAVIWFADSILPLIRATAPDAQFHVVGASPALSVQKLAERPGIFVTGRVPDVRPYVAHASACVAPMRIARGIQNKVLEAMAMGRPVVVTTDALEGIDAEPGTELLLANDEAGFAAACLRAAGPDGAAIGVAARARVLADYVWAERLRGFDDLLEPVS